MATATFISCAVTGYIRHNSVAVDGEVRSFSVLVVDDDPNIRKMIIAALRREGYSFLEAPNGREALDLMREHDPDVVVLDLMMPVLSGWDVLKERQQDARLSRIPVIVVSANRDPDVAVAVNAGICAFLPKPFDIGALSALVRSCMPSDAAVRGT
jgi:CheY-like chemotaxis protein